MPDLLNTKSHLTEWFLTAEERGNPATLIDRRHPDARAWTAGNEVTPLVHGSDYFSALVAVVKAMGEGDLLCFADWRGDPDERLDSEGTQVESLLCHAARRGVAVRGLIWRSHLDKLQFSASENRHLGEEINAAGGRCVLDQRVRPGGSHHQKFVVARHPDRPALDVAFVGGIDLCHSRRDDATHGGDPQSQPMAAVYGSSPPWHDIQLKIQGPAVGDIETVFRERWQDRTPLSLNPVRLVRDRLSLSDARGRSLPDQLPDPEIRGAHAVQILRTYPARWPRYPFAPDGERSVARAIGKVLDRARRMIYIEDQYFWSKDIAAGFCKALVAQPDLRMIGVLPLYPDQDGATSLAPNLIGRSDALELLTRAAPGRVAFYGIENHSGVPVYVHAKVCVVDDIWASVGSDNFNLRSWTHDSELSCAVLSEDAELGRGYAAELRLRLAAEHLDRDLSDVADLAEPLAAFDAFAASAAALDRWHADGCKGPRPQGRLRRYATPQLSRVERLWSRPVYRTLFDPDGRRKAMRVQGTF